VIQVVYGARGGNDPTFGVKGQVTTMPNFRFGCQFGLAVICWSRST